MDIVYHLGAHCTDEERLVRTFLRNKGALAAEGIIVPAPGRYRRIFRDTLIALKGGTASAEMQAVILDATMDEDSARRLIFSHEYFLCIPARVVGDQGFLPMAGPKVAALANVFPEHSAEFHMAMRNPATLIPALVAQIPGGSYEGMMDGIDPRTLRWAPVVREMRAAVPGAPLVVWCNEDTPLLWPDILRTVAGYSGGAELEGGDDILEAIISPAGLTKLHSYLETHPPQTGEQRRRIVSAFLGKFALDDQLEVEVPMPGWTDALVEEITAGYEADMAEIAAMPDVTFLLP
jgi:hypothetical protein